MRPLRYWLTVLSLVLGSLACQPDTRQPAARPQTPAEGAVSVLRQFGELGSELLPLVEQGATQPPMMRFYVGPDSAGGRPADQLAQYRRLVRESPDIGNEMAALLQGQLLPSLLAKPDPEPLMRVLRQYPDSDLAWYLLAGLQVQQGEEAAALASLDRAIELNDQVGIYYRQRALLRSAAKQPQAALADMQRALALYTAKPAVSRELADLYGELGDDRAVVRIWDGLIGDMHRTLTQVEQQRPLHRLRRDSLRQELTKAYIDKAMYFIYKGDTARGCPVLRQAAALGLDYIDEVQREYCR
jgi:tetratricopeptide (TPR) repeat protein